MGHKLAIDFGTTNSVIARWNDQAEANEFIVIPGLSTDTEDSRQLLIPSLLYVQDGRSGQVTIGQAVLDDQLDRQANNRLFRSFKRGITTSTTLIPRIIDGAPWTDQDAGQHFLLGLMKAIPSDAERPHAAQDVEQLILTVPVAAVEGYVAWLSKVMKGFFSPEAIHIVDEPTAAALGYAITEPEALVLVFDFGGGTLDLSLVQLPKSRGKTGGLLQRLIQGGAQQHTARVIAKAGLALGGSDVDQWLLAEVLKRTSEREASALSIRDLDKGYATLLAACEQAKVTLSTVKATTVTFESGDGQSYTLPFERVELETLLEENGFYDALRQAVDKVVYIAQRRGIFREDINHVLMVGGMSLMPSVQRTLKGYFKDTAVRVDKPFTAIAEGALQIAAGFGLEDYLAHSYGLRYLDPETGQHQYDEIVPMGSRYPTEKPVKVLIGAAHPNQEAVEFVIGQIDTDAVSMIEVRHEGGQTVFIAQANRSAQTIIPLNKQPTLVHLVPPGVPGEGRLEAQFIVDEQRQLRLTVIDLKTKSKLLHNAVVVKLREDPPNGSYPETLAEATSRVSGLRHFGFAQGDLGEEALALLEATIPGWEPSVLISRRKSDSEAESQITKREPRLSFQRNQPGQYRLSPRGLGTMLNLLPPEAVSLEAVAEALRSTEFYVRYNAAEMLSKRGDRDARLILQEVLNSGNAPMRASVAHHLHRFSWFVAEPLLRQALKDPDPRVHVSAIYALCQKRSSDAYQLMMEALPDENDEVRLAAAWGLSHGPDARAIPVLEILLQSQDPQVREQTLETLGATRAMEAIPIVRQAIDDPNLDVKYAAVLSLVELAGEACFPELASLIEETRGLMRRCFLRGLFHVTNYEQIDIAQSPAADRVVDALEAALLDDLPEVRIAAALPLAWMQHDRAATVLLEGYRRERDSTTKAHILHIAVSFMTATSEEILQDGLGSFDTLVRETAEYHAHIQSSVVTTSK